MSDAFDDVLGQASAVRVLRAAVTGGRLASAYLFEGPSGVGKERTALALAQAVIAAQTEPAKREDVRRRIASGHHPDVRIFRPRDEGDRNLEVKTIREQLLPFTQFAPFEARSAFVLLPEADVSFPANHPQGPNALLKTLEEPRPGVHFLLLAERPDRLLVTIRSRCQKIRFGRLPEDALQGILAAHGTPDEARTAAVALADGRADRALALAREGAADGLLDTAIRIDEAAGRAVPGELVALAEGLGKDPELTSVLDALTMYYRDVAAAALGVDDAKLAFRHRAERIRARAALVGASRAAVAAERIHAAELRLDQNANKEILLGRLLFELG